MNSVGYLENSFGFLNELTRPIPEQKWWTKNEMLYEDEHVILRFFPGGKGGNCILIVPPQAGHHSRIADYPKQSLVKKAIDASIGPVFAVEWKNATYEIMDHTIDDYILSLKKCIKTIFRKKAQADCKVVLIGLCQGGWLSCIYAALFPNDLSALILAGAPIDFHAGERADGFGIREWVKMMPYWFYWSMVTSGGGIMKGQNILNGFKVMNCYDRFVGDYIKLWRDLNDKKAIERFRTFRDWYEWTQDLPGAFYLQIVSELFMKNMLIKGELVILGKIVNLKDIACPSILIAGNKDDITPPEQLFNFVNYVHCDTYLFVAESGHIGLFMGKETLEKVWGEKVFPLVKRLLRRA